MTNVKKSFEWCGKLGILSLAVIVGCGDSSTNDRFDRGGLTLPAIVALGAQPGEVIVAQGQLEPASGIIAIVAPPGDRVETIAVKEGQAVEVGTALGRLASQAAKELELEIANARRDEATVKMKADEAAANAKLDVAKVGLRQAKRTLDQSVKNLAQAKSDGGKLGLLAQQVALAESKLKQLRTAAAERDGARLVSANSLEQQQLAVDQARADLTGASRDAEEKIAEGKSSIEIAEKEITATELAITSAKSLAGLQSMNKQIELLELQLRTIKLTSPVAATVISIDSGPGEPTTTMPIMRLANTSNMVARAEVNVAELPRLELGAKATITSAALFKDNAPEALVGRVASISQVIGSPRLPSPNPMARVDWRSVEVVIEIDPAFAPLAATRLQLQVDIAIQAKPAKQ